MKKHEHRDRHNSAIRWGEQFTLNFTTSLISKYKLTIRADLELLEQYDGNKEAAYLRCNLNEAYSLYKMNVEEFVTTATPSETKRMFISLSYLSKTLLISCKKMNDEEIKLITKNPLYSRQNHDELLQDLESLYLIADHQLELLPNSTGGRPNSAMPTKAFVHLLLIIYERYTSPDYDNQKFNFLKECCSVIQQEKHITEHNIRDAMKSYGKTPKKSH